VPEGELHNFTVLLGVALTDAPTPNMGNFGYIPCSHAALARALPDEAAALALGVAGAARWKEALGVDLGLLAPPQALCCRAGSAYLAHYSTVHFCQPNACGIVPRVAVYFRITGAERRQLVAEGKELPKTRPAALTRGRLWLEYPGIRALQNEPR